MEESEKNLFPILDKNLKSTQDVGFRFRDPVKIMKDAFTKEGKSHYSNSKIKKLVNFYYRMIKRRAQTRYRFKIENAKRT